MIALAPPRSTNALGRPPRASCAACSPATWAAASGACVSTRRIHPCVRASLQKTASALGDPVAAWKEVLHVRRQVELFCDHTRSPDTGYLVCRHTRSPGTGYLVESGAALGQ